MTPRVGGLKDATQVSLLFTPAAKGADGQKATPDYRTTSHLGRSPSATPAYGAGRNPFPTGGREQATPPSRRRSLTPASSMARDTPPPPPSESLLDSPAPGTLPGWGQAHAEAGGAEEKMVSTSPLSAGPPQQQQQQQRQRDLARAAHQQYEDTWVTVFGFGAADVPLVLREFGRCGDMAQFGSFGEGAAVNWLHICYANKYGAQRALLRSGEQLSRQCMVGVKPLDATHRAAVERYLAAGGGGGGGERAAYAPPCPRPAAAAARAYSIDGGALAGGVVPLRAESTWAKVSQFVFGL